MTALHLARDLVKLGGSPGPCGAGFSVILVPIHLYIASVIDPTTSKRVFVCIIYFLLSFFFIISPKPNTHGIYEYRQHLNPSKP